MNSVRHFGLFRLGIQATTHEEILKGPLIQSLCLMCARHVFDLCGPPIKQAGTNERAKYQIAGSETDWLMARPGRDVIVLQFLTERRTTGAIPDLRG